MHPWAVFIITHGACLPADLRHSNTQDSPKQKKERKKRRKKTILVAELNIFVVTDLTNYPRSRLMKSCGKQTEERMEK
jgi:hypothetical protein